MKRSVPFYETFEDLLLSVGRCRAQDEGLYRPNPLWFANGQEESINILLARVAYAEGALRVLAPKHACTHIVTLSR